MSRNRVYQQQREAAEKRAIGRAWSQARDEEAAQQVRDMPRPPPQHPPASVEARGGQSPDQVEAKEKAAEPAQAEPGFTPGEMSREELAAKGGILGASLRETAKVIGSGGAEALDESIATAGWAWGMLTPGEAQYRDVQFFSKMVAEPDTELGSALVPLVQFAMPFGAGMKAANALVKGGKVAAVAKSYAVGALVDAAVFDPYQERLMNLVAEIPGLEDPIREWIDTSDPSDPDNVLKGKILNALEGGMLGVVADGAFRLIRLGVMRIRAGKAERGLTGGDKAQGKEGAVEDAKGSATVADATAPMREGHYQADLSALDNARKAGESEEAWTKRIAANRRRSGDLTESEQSLEVKQQGKEQKKAKAAADKKAEEERRAGLTDEELAAEDKQRAFEDRKKRAYKAVRSHADQQAREQHARWELRPTMPKPEETNIESWLLARGVKEEVIEERVALINEVDELLDPEVDPDLAKAGLDELLDQPAGSLLADALTWRTTKFETAVEVRAFYESVTSLQPRMDPRDVAEVMRGAWSRMAQVSNQAAESGESAIQSSVYYSRARRALWNLKSGPEDPERMQRALDAMNDMTASWNPDKGFAAPTHIMLTGPKPGDLAPGTRPKLYVFDGTETPSSIHANAPATQGTLPGDLDQLYNDPDYWPVKPSTERLLMGSETPVKPRYVEMSALDGIDDIVLLEKEMAARRGRSGWSTVDEGEQTPADRRKLQLGGGGGGASGKTLADGSDDLASADIETTKKDLERETESVDAWLEGAGKKTEETKEVADMNRPELEEALKKGREDILNANELMDEGWDEGMVEQQFGRSPAQLEADVIRIEDALRAADPDEFYGPQIDATRDPAYAEAKLDANMAKQAAPDPRLAGEGALTAEEAVIEAARRETLTDLAAQSLDNLIRDTVPLNWHMRTKSVQRETAPEQLDMMLTAAHSVSSLARAAVNPQASLHTTMSFLSSLYRYDAMAHYVKGDIKTARSLLNRASEVYSGGVEEFAKHGGNKTVRALAAMMDAQGTLNETMRVASQWHRPDRVGGFWQSIWQIRANSLLSGPGTHNRNNTGNLVPVLLSLPEQLLRSRLEQGGFNRAVWEDLTLRAKGLAFGTKRGWQLASGDFLINNAGQSKATEVQRRLAEQRIDWYRQEFSQQPHHDPGNLVMDGADAAMRDLNLGTTNGKWFNDAIARKVRNNRVLKGSFSALQAEDMYFKSTNYMMEAYVQAGKQARGEGLSGQALSARVDDILKGNNVDSPIHKKALEAAEGNTFTNDLESQAFGETGQQLLNKWGGLGRALVPFYRTPINIVKMNLRYTPGINRVLADVQRARAAPKGSPERVAQQARDMVGGVLWVGAGALVASGNVTGTGKGYGYRKRGVPNSSIRIGGEWYRYDHLPVIGFPLSVISTGWELASAAKSPEEIEVAEVVVSVGQALIGQIVSDAWAEGLLELYEMVEGGRAGQAVPKLVLDTLSPVVNPVQSLDRWATRMAQSDSLAEAWEGGERVQTRVQDPGGREDEGIVEQAWEEFRTFLNKTFPAGHAMFGTQHKVLDQFGDEVNEVVPTSGWINGEWVDFNQTYIAGQTPLAMQALEKTELINAQHEVRWSPPNVPWEHTYEYLGKPGSTEYSQEQYTRRSKIQGSEWRKLALRTISAPGWEEMTALKRRRRLTQAFRVASARAKMQMEVEYPTLRVRQLEFEERVTRRMEG